jgi:hypothetical protein
MQKLTLFAAATGSRVDREAGVLRGVSVITAGVEAKGHGIWIDQTSLEMVKASAETYVDGLQVKSDHGSGFGEIEGVLRDFVIDGNQLRADFHLIKSGEEYERICEMAEMMPSSFGLSIEFSGVSEEIDEYRYARPVEIYAVALVDQPAANPSGLFQAMSEPETAPVEVPAEAPVEEIKAEEVTAELEVKGPEGTQNLPEEVAPAEAPVEKVEEVKAEEVPAEPDAKDDDVVTELPEGFSSKLSDVVLNFENTKAEVINLRADLEDLPEGELSSKLSDVVLNFENTKAEVINLRADLETAHRNLTALKAEVEKRDLAIAKLEEIKRTALRAVGLLPSDVELEIDAQAAPFNPVEAYAAAVEAGDKKLAAELFKAHKTAIFAARRN